MSDNQREAGTIVLDPTHASFSPQEGVNDLGATHFIGIGGAGMSVLAEMLHEQGVEVDGSDREPSAKTDRLQGIGITVEFGQRAENVEGKHTVVFSSAIKSDNPEIVAAYEAGERIVHRSDILALLMNAKRAVTAQELMAKPRPVPCSPIFSPMPVREIWLIQAMPLADPSKARTA